MYTILSRRSEDHANTNIIPQEQSVTETISYQKPSRKQPYIGRGAYLSTGVEEP